MLSQSAVTIAVIILAMLSAGGLAFALLYSNVTGEARSEKRRDAITARHSIVADRRSAADVSAKKKNIQDALKEFDLRQIAKAKKVNSPPLQLRLQQAGLKWSKRTYFIMSFATGAVLALVAFIMHSGLIVAGGLAVIGGLGLPRWFIGFMRKRRMAKFLHELPNAVDVIVRGIKSGLPLGDCLRIIANEASEPVRSEFRQIVETQQMGVTVGDACMMLFERMPVQEANFFGIVIQIQQKAGGNLSEALGNLSRVLRDRKKMKAKINAMSMEAKASASIIGSLPIIVTLLVYLTTPTYIAFLFTTKAGNLIVMGGLGYMFLGIMVMKKMIEFDF